MKFKVREGFVVHVSRIIEIDMGTDEPKKEVQTNTYYQGQTVDLEPAEAEAHLHKLEPADKAAQAYAESRFAVVTTPVTGTGMNSDTLAQIVAAAVAQALATQAPAQPLAPSGTSGS